MFRKHPKSPDFNTLTDLIERGIEEAMASIRNSHPDENFYAYVLSTHGDVSSVSFHANSFENLAQVYEASKIETDPAKIEDGIAQVQAMFDLSSKKTAKMRRAKAAELSYYKWGWMEWMDYECIGNKALMNKTGDWLETQSQHYLDKDGALGAAWFKDGLDSVLTCMKRALKRCDANGHFGTGEERETALLYTGTYDGDTYGARALNPKASLKKYGSDFELKETYE